MKDILQYCTQQQGWLLGMIEALVRIESPTGVKEAVDRCGHEVAARFEEAGGHVTRLPQETAGDHLRVEFGEGGGQVLLLGHFDTVWPLGQLERMPLDHREGCLFGPGVYDMKSGIALALLAMKALLQRDRLPGHRIVMLWTSDEETGSASSREIIEAEANRSHAVLVLEPALPDGSIKTSRKGCGDFTVEVTGVLAHAGVEPEKGSSAIHEMAHQIAALEALNDPARGISVNVGTISGGTRINVVAEQAVAGVDVRVPTLEAAAAIGQAIRHLTPRDPRNTIVVRGGIDRPPMERGPGVVALLERARDVASDLGGTVREQGTGGGSDGNFTAALGIPTLDGLGAVGAGAHALHEHIVVSELPWRAALLAGLMARIETG